MVLPQTAQNSAPPDAAPPRMPTIGAQEFQNYELPVPVPRLQPEGWTVTRYRTNVYTDARQHTLRMTLLGYPVRVRATPVSYRWDFGDGDSMDTTNRGKRISQNDDPVLFHVYDAPGAVKVTLTTRYRGEYSVDGSGWTPIPGQATVTSAAIPLQVYRYHRYGVAESCAQDPTGPDCRTNTPPRP